MSHIHPTAVISSTVVILEDVFIGPYSVIGFQDSQSEIQSVFDLNTVLKKTIIGPGTRIFSHCFIAEGVTVGELCTIESHTHIGSGTIISNNVELEYGARIYCDARIGCNTSIGGFVCNRAIIGDGCVFQGKLIHARRIPGDEPSPIIEDDVFVGTDAVVIGNVRIQKGAFVAAKSVVTKDVPENMLARGSPARVVGQAPKWK